MCHISAGYARGIKLFLKGNTGRRGPARATFGDVGITRRLEGWPNAGEISRNGAIGVSSDERGHITFRVCSVVPPSM